MDKPIDFRPRALIMHKPDPFPFVTAATAELIRIVASGDVDLDFVDPDDCKPVLTKEAALQIISKMFDADPKFVAEDWIFELLNRPLNLICAMHPDYDRNVREYEESERRVSELIGEQDHAIADDMGVMMTGRKIA